MSLVMAVVCTDGIVVSGDFRRSRSTMNPETGAEQIIEFHDDTHKIIKTKSNRIVGHTGDCSFKDGESVEDVIDTTLRITDMAKTPIDSEFAYLVSAVRYNKNALIEAGIINGHKIILTWKQGELIKQVLTKGCAIGNTNIFEKYKEKFENEIQNITTEEAIPLLQKYNRLIANEEATISPECEIMVIKPANLDQLV